MGAENRLCVTPFRSFPIFHRVSSPHPSRQKPWGTGHAIYSALRRSRTLRRLQRRRLLWAPDLPGNGGSPQGNPGPSIHGLFHGGLSNCAIRYPITGPFPGASARPITTGKLRENSGKAEGQQDQGRGGIPGRGGSRPFSDWERTGFHEHLGLHTRRLFPQLPRPVSRNSLRKKAKRISPSSWSLKPSDLLIQENRQRLIFFPLPTPGSGLPIPRTGNRPGPPSAD